jgi:hypothetical protein
VTVGQAASIVLDAPRQTGVVVLSNALPVKMKAPPDGGVGAADLARHLIRPVCNPTRPPSLARRSGAGERQR